MGLEHKQKQSHIDATDVTAYDVLDLLQGDQLVITEDPGGKLEVVQAVHKMKLDDREQQHKFNMERREQQHKYRMDTLQYTVPIVSGVIFAVLGLVLIQNTEILIKYLGLTSFGIGACALIPGISRVFRAVADIVKGFREFADATKEIALRAASQEMEIKE